MEGRMQRYSNCRTCNIHAEESFAIDEECPQCEKDSEFAHIETYQNHIEYLDRQARKLEKSLKECRSHLTESVCKECKCENTKEMNLLMLSRNTELRAKNENLKKELDELKVKCLRVISQ